MNIIKLPVENIYDICYNLNYKDLVNLGMTCKVMNKITSDNKIWYNIYIRYYNIKLNYNNIIWKELFIKTYKTKYNINIILQNNNIIKNIENYALLNNEYIISKYTNMNKKYNNYFLIGISNNIITDIRYYKKNNILYEISYKHSLNELDNKINDIYILYENNTIKKNKVYIYIYLYIKNYLIPKTKQMKYIFVILFINNIIYENIRKDIIKINNK